MKWGKASNIIAGLTLSILILSGCSPNDMNRDPADTPAVPEIIEPETPDEPKPVTPDEPKSEQPDEPKPETPDEPKPVTPDEPKPITPDEPKPEAPDEPKPVTPDEPKPEASKAETALQKMSLREKVGQLFIIRPDALNFSSSQETVDGTVSLSDEMKASLQEYPAGGIIMFSKNINSPDQITQFNRELRENSAVPPFLCVDEEGGLVARLANHPNFSLPQYQSAAAVGKSGDPADAQNMGQTIGEYLREFGFNVDFAPVADVNTNPNNPVIGTRAFSSDPETAALMAGAMADGLRQSGIMPVFKHFPGHGDTQEDSHAGIAITNKSVDEMKDCEWIPFRQAGENDGIMVGHISAPQITGGLTPATMSKQMISILKEQLGFQGLIITDSLAMGAVTDSYDPVGAAISAFQAGCDILLMPKDYREAFDGILSAVENGTITEQELDEKVLHILHCKEFLGL